MKRFFYLATLVALAIGLTTSCDSDDPDYHALGFRSLSVNTIPVQYFADQTSDSLLLTSTDSWKANTNSSWISFTKSNNSIRIETVKYSYGTEYAFREPITIGPNLTNNIRYANISATANNRTINLNIAQNYWLNVIDPVMTPTGLISADGEDFVKTIEKTANTTTIAFNVYNPATLSTTADWITINQTDYNAGRYTVNIGIQPNSTGNKRDGIIKLKSSTGVETPIIIRQKG